MSEEKREFNPFLLANTALIVFLLIFMPLSRGGVNMWQQTVMALVVQAGLLILFVENKLTGKPGFKKTQLFYPICVLPSWVLLSLYFSPVKPVCFMALYKLFVYVGFYYLLIHNIRTRKHRLYLVYLIVFIAILLSLIGFLQLTGLTFSWWRYWEIENIRLMTATYGNHNHLAGYLEMVAPLVISLILIQRNLIIKILLCFAALLIASAHLLSLSRGGWASISVSLLFFVAALFIIRDFKKKKSLFIITAVVSFSIFVGLMGSNVVERAVSLTEEETFNSFAGRNVAWEGTLAMIQGHKYVGTGPGSYSTIFTQYQPPGIGSRFYYAHNDYLQYTAELGYPILLFMLWFVYNLFAVGLKKLRSRSKQTWGITLGALTGVIALLSHSFIDFNLHIPANALLFIALFALVMETGSESNRSGQPGTAEK